MGIQKRLYDNIYKEKLMVPEKISWCLTQQDCAKTAQSQYIDLGI